MLDRMIRFLHSIGIEDYENYDLDFDKITKSQFFDNGFSFVIKKDSPWSPYQADHFISGLNKLKYQYEILFIYNCDFDEKSLNELIVWWYFNNVRKELKANFSFTNNQIKYIFQNELENLEFSKNIEDLQDFLNFLNYPISVSCELKQEKNEENYVLDDSKFDIKKIEEEAEVEALNSLKETYENRVFDERQKLLFKKGDYQHVDISEIDSNSGNIEFQGFIFECSIKDTRKGGKIASVGVGKKGHPDAIYVTFISNEKNLKKDDFESLNAIGKNICVKGKADLDRFKRNLYVMGHYFEILPDDEPRKDLSNEKRVELHLHSKMSEMDAVSTISDYCKLAKSMGHKAIAITDHGVAQAFPEAQQAAKKYGIKMLYGSEVYMIEDYFTGCLNPSNARISDATYVCFDLESTGLSIKYDRITEFGAVKIQNGLVVDRLDILINPEIEIPKHIQEKTHITTEMVKNQPPIRDVMNQILDFIKGTIIVSHNIEFDYGMLNEAMEREGFGSLNMPAIDTLAISRYVFPENRGHTLGHLCKRLEIIYDTKSAHRADYDAEVLANCWMSLRTSFIKKDPNIMHKDLEKLEIPNSSLKYLRSSHVVLIAKNHEGLKDLYKIISYAHCDTMGSQPLVPRHLISEYRKNLFVGSACFNGEVFYSSTNRSMKKLHEAVKFYDYIEIQPLENYSYLINMNEIPSEKMLKQYIKDIISVAEMENKLICATGDCHYLNPEDKIYRDVYISNQAVGGVNHPLMPFSRSNRQVEDNYFFENPDQHFRSTDEMLDCFRWLGEEKAYEYVIKNTNIIADGCEVIIPIPENKLFTPTIENCENLLRDLCFNTANNLYGDIKNSDDKAKKFIYERLETELDGIISNGYSVIYYIAHKLVKKSNEDGFIIGSRGSVGSSFAATMAGITEVNPLPPHYRCPHCKKVIFYEGNDITSGFDLPDMLCPECGEKMISDGQNIPFQTFLGFKAEKVPDIDLNFPTDYQAKAHLYTKVLLGADKVYRAGTISTVQFKTAYGYARKYFEKMKVDPDKIKPAVLAELAYGCQEVKRTTGQHPGGIVVIPTEYDVYDFTPVQYPAGNVEAAWKTTHFDFHSIHDTILKLDMLGHVDPQALKMMNDLSKFSLYKIPFNDKNVISLFSTDKALKLEHKYMPEDNGALGLPEFGTPFVRQMLRETLPKSFSDLLIISGLSHGTDVWNNNAQNLIQKNITNLRGVIGCRDDIMTYLISHNIDGHEAFVIMEAVRKGKQLKPEWETLMREHNVPDYYIDSCNKIKYLFPKGHACAYVMMALRVGYYKIYYPLEFYATFFTLRCEQYDIESMLKGSEGIFNKLQEYSNRRKSNNPEKALSPKEEEIEKTLQVALEMTERGYKFVNIDIEKSDATNFIVDKERKALIPPFKVLDGFGEKGGEALIQARNEKPFISQEDLLQRGKISKTNLKQLKELGVLDSLTESNQLSLFDFMI